MSVPAESSAPAAALKWRSAPESRYWWDADGYRISMAWAAGPQGLREAYTAWRRLDAAAARAQGFPVGAYATEYAQALGMAETFEAAAALCEADRGAAGGGAPNP